MVKLFKKTIFIDLHYHENSQGSWPYCDYEESNFQKAITAVKSGSMSCRAAAHKFNVLKSMVNRKVKNPPIKKYRQPKAVPR